MTQAIASPIVHDLIGVGFGPSNLALAIALQCGRPVHECFYAACAESAQAEPLGARPSSQVQLRYLP